jgi:hypothetical protein
VCKILVRRLYWLVLVLLLSAGSAWCQFQNPIAWGWSPPPASTGGTDNSPQSAAPSNASDTSVQQMGDQSSQPSQTASDQSSGDVQSQGQSQTSQDSSDQSSSNPQSQSSVNLSGQGAADGTGVNPATGDTVINGPANPNATARFPFPVQSEPQGIKIGPVYLTNISDSFFYAINTAPGQPSTTFSGNSISAELVCNKQIGSGTLAIQGREQFSLSQLTPYFNQSVSVSYSNQLSERWTLNASAQFTYFQNSILANPQYLLSYQNSGLVVQTLFALQRGSTLYESNALDFSYQLSGRTHLTLSPIVGATFLEQNGTYTNAQQFGGAVGVTRDVTDNLNLGAYYFLSHSLTSGVANSPGWTSQSLGASFQYRFNTWVVAGSLAASGQLIAQVWDLTPGGSISVRKAFTTSSIYGAYTRAEASTVFVSSGYFDQGDIGYHKSVGQKLQLNLDAGFFRTINTGITQKGKRVGGSLSYRWKPRLNLNASYNYAHQVGADTSSFSPLLGNTSAFSFGISWKLGAESGN